MIEITGQYNSAVVFSDTLDASAEGQIQAFCDQPASAGSRIRIMPDVHTGAGCAIGTTMTVTDKVFPNLVGVDIGCGMETVRLKAKHLELQQLDKLIRANIPGGVRIRTTAHRFADRTDLSQLKCAKHMKLDRAALSVGTLGGGNHFIEVDKDDEGNLYLVVHTGSRHLGLEIAQHYLNAAYARLKGKVDIPFVLAYAEGELFGDYIHDMKLAQAYAQINREAIVDEILKGLKLKEADRFTTVHNYIDTDAMILRKGAVSAREGETLLVPINMRDGSLVCTGLGNGEWNFSAPHGAGRLMSRTKAKESFTVSAFKKEMEGIYSTSISQGTLDECPMAYKSRDYLLAQIGPTAKAEKVIRPIFNHKAAN